MDGSMYHLVQAIDNIVAHFLIIWYCDKVKLSIIYINKNL